MELEITWGRAVRVWWAYFWRNILAVVAAMVAGGLVGGAIGFVLGLVGASKTTIQYVVTPIGAVIGLAISVVPMKMILGKTFGDFKLVLVSKSESSAS